MNGLFHSCAAFLPLASTCAGIQNETRGQALRAERVHCALGALGDPMDVLWA